MFPLLQTGLARASLKDSRLGQMLDAWLAATLHPVLSALARTALEVDAIPPPWMHQDTTTMALSGAYQGDEAPSEPGAQALEVPVAPHPADGQSTEGRHELQPVWCSLGGSGAGGLPRRLGSRDGQTRENSESEGPMKTAAYPTIASGKPHDMFKALLESVSEAVFVIEPSTGRLLEANPQAASALGYTRAELLALKADQVFSPETEFLQQITTDNRASSRSGVKLVTKHSRRLGSVVTTRPVAHHGRAVVLAIAHNAVPTAALAPGQTSTRRPDADERTEESEEVIETTFTFPSIIGQSTQIRKVCRLIGLVAQTDTTVLIQGESGTGKELVGQAIHFHSRRSSRPFIKVNCAALSETLLESELFGHRKGAFTGAVQDRKGRFKLADSGTIILDEIDSLSLSGQAKLLRVLQEKEFALVGDSTTVRVDVRVIAITNADLMQAINAGHFREDLYYRLNAFPIHLPSLRERKEDIPLLVHHFLTSYTASLKKQITDIDAVAMALLTDYAWPGNVRELENAIEYAVILERGPVLTASSLPDKLQLKTTRHQSLKERLELVERQIILEALKTSNGVKARTAALLGIDRRNLSYFLQKHDIHTPSVHA